LERGSCHRRRRRGIFASRWSVHKDVCPQLIEGYSFRPSSAPPGSERMIRSNKRSRGNTTASTPSHFPMKPRKISCSRNSGMIEALNLSNAITSISIVATNIQTKRSSRLRSPSRCNSLSSAAALSSTLVGREVSAMAVKSSGGRGCTGVLGDDVCVGNGD
jgi:hypothetical protein